MRQSHENQNCRTHAPALALESLESRQMMSVAMVGSATAALPRTLGEIVQNLRRTRTPSALAGTKADPLGVYSGKFQSPTGVYGGAINISILGQDSQGAYYGYLGFDAQGQRQRLGVQIRVAADGQFSIRFVTAKLAVQASGKIDFQTGKMTGNFSATARNWQLGGQLVMTRAQALASLSQWA